MKFTLFLAMLLAAAAGIFADTDISSQSAASGELVEAVEEKYRQVLQLDDQSMTEIQALLEKHNHQDDSTAPRVSEEELRKMIQFKIAAVKMAYTKFLEENPTHVKAMIAYGSFLCDLQENQHGIQWWLKARKLDPKNPAVRNNLANHYTHSGEPKRAIEEYEAAIALRPSEPVYHFNYANAIYLFRKDAAALKNWSGDEILDHALASLKKARDLEPTNYDYAYAYAETFYGLQHPNWKRAVEAWEYCLKLNITPAQRDQVYTHLARIQIRLGNIPQAREYLAKVETAQFRGLRDRLNQIADQQDPDTRVSDMLKRDTAVPE